MDIVYYTPWGILTLNELMDMARCLQDKGDLDAAHDMFAWVDEAVCAWMCD